MNSHSNLSTSWLGRRQIFNGNVLDGTVFRQTYGAHKRFPRAGAPLNLGLALVNNFERVAIRIEHVSGVIAGIVFQTSTRRDIVLCARSDCSLVEGIHRFVVFCDEAPV